MNGMLKALSRASQLSVSTDPEEALEILNNIRFNLTQEDLRLINPICDAISISAFHQMRCLHTPERKSKKLANVYFLQRPDGKIKIGHSQDVKRRLKQIAPMAGDSLEILLVISGGSSLEVELHKQFGNEKHHGEWFQPSKHLLAFIKKQTMIGDPKSMSVK